ncbi:CSN-associated deubiquitinating enzyme Ubp12, partial [Cryomyces antarcticus]
MHVMPDPELDAQKAKRAARKKNGITLDDCFAETAKSEILSEENAWYCNRCKELRRASKTLEIWTVPDILVVHLKRFSANRGFRDKIDVLVDFPIKGLDLSDRVGLQR